MISNNGGQSFVSSVSPVMRPVERTIQEIARTDIPVLLVGESGTGKGALALRIHQLSRHCHESFVKMNCAELSAVFSDGHDGSALKHSLSSRFATGTVFLDEVGDLDALSQPKLLYILPDSEDSASEAPHMRIISSTCRNLDQEVHGGRFREDLYYRLSGVRLNLPTLCRRKEDIPALVDFFLVKYAALMAKSKPAISPLGMRVLLDYSWPGNIRELEYTIQKIIALGDEDMAIEELRAPRPTVLNPTASGVSLKQTARAASRQAERELILKVLSQTRWNRKRAAQELQISYKALLYKLKQMGLGSAGA